MLACLLCQSGIFYLICGLYGAAINMREAPGMHANTRLNIYSIDRSRFRQEEPYWLKQLQITFKYKESKKKKEIEKKDASYCVRAKWAWIKISWARAANSFVENSGSCSFILRSLGKEKRGKVGFVHVKFPLISSLNLCELYCDVNTCTMTNRTKLWKPSIKYIFF